MAAFCALQKHHIGRFYVKLRKAKGKNDKIDYEGCIFPEPEV